MSNGQFIREELSEDIGKIRDLTYKAFDGHPQHKPGEPPKEHLIIDRLRKKGALSLSMVYQEDGEVLGHIAYSPVLIDGRDLNWLGLGPISVLPDFQKRGIGGKLIKYSIEKLKAEGIAGIALVGDPNYYGRFGFKTGTALSMPGVPDEYFMVLPLEGEVPAGSLEIDKAFFE